MSKRPGFIIINLTRGWFDGNYFVPEDEMPKLTKYWQECFPNDNIVYVKTVGTVDLSNIPEIRWMPNNSPGIGKFAQHLPLPEHSDEVRGTA